MGVLVANRGPWVCIVCDSIVVNDVRKVEDVVFRIHGEEGTGPDAGNGEGGEGEEARDVDWREAWER